MNLPTLNLTLQEALEWFNEDIQLRRVKGTDQIQVYYPDFDDAEHDYGVFDIISVDDLKQGKNIIFDSVPDNILESIADDYEEHPADFDETYAALAKGEYTAFKAMTDEEIAQLPEVQVYNVEITETICRTIPVTAETPEAAQQIIEDAYRNGDIELYDQDYFGTEFQTLDPDPLGTAMQTAQEMLHQTDKPATITALKNALELAGCKIDGEKILFKTSDDQYCTPETLPDADRFGAEQKIKLAVQIAENMIDLEEIHAASVRKAKEQEIDWDNFVNHADKHDFVSSTGRSYHDKAQVWELGDRKTLVAYNDPVISVTRNGDITVVMTNMSKTIKDIAYDFVKQERAEKKHEPTAFAKQQLLDQDSGIKR